MKWVPIILKLQVIAIEIAITAWHEYLSAVTGSICNIKVTTLQALRLLKHSCQAAFLSCTTGWKNFHWMHWINCRVPLMPTWLDSMIECSIRPWAWCQIQNSQILKPSSKPHGKHKILDSQHIPEWGLTSLQHAVSDSFLWNSVEDWNKLHL